MQKRTLAALVGLGLLIGVGLPLSNPSTAHATTDDPYTVVLWSVPAGADPLTVDQPYVTSAPGKSLDALDGSMKCGTTYQVDVYRTALDDGTPVSSLWADGALHPNHDGAYLAYDALPTPYKIVTTDACAPVVPPKPADDVRHGTWADERGAITCERDTVLQARTVTTVPYVLDTASNTWKVNPDQSTWIVTVEERERPKTPAEVKACATTTPPTTEPTPPTTEPTPPVVTPTPAPSTEPTTTPTASTPRPPASTVPAAPVPPSSKPSPSASSEPTPSVTASAVPVVDGTTPTETLAYTGVSRDGMLIGAVSALVLLALGGIILVMRRRALHGGR